MRWRAAGALRRGDGLSSDPPDPCLPNINEPVVIMHPGQNRLDESWLLAWEGSVENFRPYDCNRATLTPVRLCLLRRSWVGQVTFIGETLLGQPTLECMAVRRSASADEDVWRVGFLACPRPSCFRRGLASGRPSNGSPEEWIAVSAASSACKARLPCPGSKFPKRRTTSADED